MEQKNYMLAVNGGRKGGRTSRYLQSILTHAKSRGATTKMIELTDLELAPLNRVTEDPELDKLENIRIKARLKKFIMDLKKADGIVFGSPVHWFSTSSEMKIFIDYLTPLENEGFLLEGKVAGFVVYGNEGGKMNVLMQLAAAANHMGMLVPPYAMIYFGKERATWAGKDLLLLSENMLKLIGVIKESKIRFGYE